MSKIKIQDQKEYKKAWAPTDKNLLIDLINNYWDKRHLHNHKLVKNINALYRTYRGKIY